MKVLVCIATYRRPRGLARLLESLARLTAAPSDALRIELLVVDNDAERSAEPTVERLRESLPFTLRYDVETARGIPQVRNRMVALAGDADWLAFVDDDEVVSPGWLAALLEVARTSGADAVLGPVDQQFSPAPPPWYRLPRKADYADGATIPFDHLRTGNLLISAAVLRTVAPPFDPRFTWTGGSDAHLGARLAERGYRLAWAARAHVTEHVPVSRVSVGWLLRRRFRMGSNRARIERDVRPGGDALREQVLPNLRNVLRLGVAVPPSLVLGWPPTVERMSRLAYSAGILAGLLGVGYDEYRHIHGE